MLFQNYVTTPEKAKLGWEKILGIKIWCQDCTLPKYSRGDVIVQTHMPGSKTEYIATAGIPGSKPKYWLEDQNTWLETSTSGSQSRIPCLKSKCLSWEWEYLVWNQNTLLATRMDDSTRRIECQEHFSWDGIPRLKVMITPQLESANKRDYCNRGAEADWNVQAGTTGSLPDSPTTKSRWCTGRDVCMGVWNYHGVCHHRSAVSNALWLIYPELACSALQDVSLCYHYCGISNDLLCEMRSWGNIRSASQDLFAIICGCAANAVWLSSWGMTRFQSESV